MAYTKYSLTPANNTAAPPDGAPEGMLPSAVNDTMRDMMAQIRDCGDGIRDGTYTMTAPKITGGTITGSTINNSAIGGTTAAAGKFTTLEATGATTFSGATVANTFSSSGATITGGTITGVAFTGNTFTSPVISGGTINNATIGATTANTGAFTTLSATGATTFSGATVVSGSLTANTFSSSGATITGGNISGSSIAATQLTGTIAAARLPTGSVLQVVSATYSTETSNSTATYSDAGLSASITPSSSSSKILILCSQGMFKSTASGGIYMQVLRDSTSILVNGRLGITDSAGVGGSVLWSCNYLDSPATTSSITYKTQFKNINATGTAYVNIDGSTAQITLLEISG